MTDYISVDIESTGYSPMQSDIIEIGAWKIKNGVVVDKFCTLVRPVVYIPSTIQEMTGITMDMVKDCETIEFVLPDFFHWCENLPFLGYNLQFDYSFLCYKGKFLGVDFTLNGLREGIDVLKLSKQFLTIPSYKLADVAKYLNISVESETGYHRAEYDAYITKLIYDRFLLGNKDSIGVKIPTILSKDDHKYGRVKNNDTLSFD